MADLRKKPDWSKAMTAEEKAASDAKYKDVSQNFGNLDSAKQELAQAGQYANRFKQQLANMGAGDVDKPMIDSQPTPGVAQQLDYQNSRETNALGRLSRPQAEMAAQYGGGEYDTDEAKALRLAEFAAQNQAQDDQEARLLQGDTRNTADLLGDSLEAKRLQAAKLRQQRLMAKLQAMQAGASPPMADPESMTPGKPEVYSTIERRR